jgi:hypothetical protein
MQFIHNNLGYRRGDETVEHKDEVVRPLAKALQEGGLRVWYDEFRAQDRR